MFTQVFHFYRPERTEARMQGHFGKTDPDITWEKTDKTEALRKACGQSKSPVAAATLKRAAALVNGRSASAASRAQISA